MGNTSQRINQELFVLLWKTASQANEKLRRVNGITLCRTWDFEKHKTFKNSLKDVKDVSRGRRTSTSKTEVFFKGVSSDRQSTLPMIASQLGRKTNSV